MTRDIYDETLNFTGGLIETAQDQIYAVVPLLGYKSLLQGLIFWNKVMHFGVCGWGLRDIGL